MSCQKTNRKTRVVEENLMKTFYLFRNEGFSIKLRKEVGGLDSQIVWHSNLYCFVGFSVALYDNCTLLNQQPESHAAWVTVLQDSISGQRIQQITRVKKREGRTIMADLSEGHEPWHWYLVHNSRFSTTVSLSIYFLVGEDDDWQLRYCSSLFVTENYVNIKRSKIFSECLIRVYFLHKY